MRTHSSNQARSVVRQHGFTLLELLVAMAVFALISVTVYSGLSHTASMRGLLHDRYDRLAELQRVLAYVERDLLQAVARPVKSPFGDMEPALKLLDAKDVTFTRTGAEGDLSATPQSSLLRLQYVLQDSALTRVIYSVLDRAQDSKLYPRQLIGGLAKFQVQALHNDEWRNEWPLSDNSAKPDDSLSQLPSVLRVTIESKDGYTLRRTIVLYESKNAAI